MFFETLGSSRDMAMSSKREVAASRLLGTLSVHSSGCLWHILDEIDMLIKRNYSHGLVDFASEEHTYRLMRVVKLCIWPPLAMIGNTLLKGVE